MMKAMVFLAFLTSTAVRAFTTGTEAAARLRVKARRLEGSSNPPDSRDVRIQNLEANAEVQGHVNAVRDAILKKLGLRPDASLVAVSYAVQVVSDGAQYFVQVRSTETGQDGHKWRTHARVALFVEPGGAAELVRAERGWRGDGSGRFNATIHKHGVPQLHDRAGVQGRQG